MSLLGAIDFHGYPVQHVAYPFSAHSDALNGIAGIPIAGTTTGTSTAGTSTARNSSAPSGILFIGLNPTAFREAHALQSTGIPLHRIFHQDSPTVSLNDRSFDLTIEAEVGHFIQGLGFQGAQAIALTEALWSLDFAIRDEVARMVQVWSMAELNKGEIPSRLVLSGHSGGRFFWGTGTSPKAFSGNLELRDLQRITRLLPKAIDRIRSIFLAGCNTGWEENLRWLASLFPHAQSLTGYTYGAPLASAESPAELRRWAQWTLRDESSLRPFAPNMAVFHPPLDLYQQHNPAGERPERLAALDTEPEWRETKRHPLSDVDFSEMGDQYQDQYQAEVVRGVLESGLRLREKLCSGESLEADRLTQLQDSIQEVLAYPTLPDRYRQDLASLHRALNQDVTLDLPFLQAQSKKPRNGVCHN